MTRLQRRWKAQNILKNVGKNIPWNHYFLYFGTRGSDHRQGVNGMVCSEVLDQVFFFFLFFCPPPCLGKKNDGNVIPLFPPLLEKGVNASLLSQRLRSKLTLWWVSTWGGMGGPGLNGISMWTPLPTPPSECLGIFWVAHLYFTPLVLKSAPPLFLPIMPRKHIKFRGLASPFP